MPWFYCKANANETHRLFFLPLVKRACSSARQLRFVGTKRVTRDRENTTERDEGAANMQFMRDMRIIVNRVDPESDRTTNTTIECKIKFLSSFNIYKLIKRKEICSLRSIVERNY